MIIVIDDDPGLSDRLEAALRGGTSVLHLPSVRAAHDPLEDPTAGVEAVVIGPSFEAQAALAGARTVRQVAPTMNTVLVLSEATPEVLRDAMRSGVTDVLDRNPTDEELADAVNRARELTNQMRGATTMSRPVSEATSQRRTITVFSTKGGSGKSLLATNLAVLLAQEAPDEVVLLDLDLQSGDTTVMLQLLPSWTIADAAARGGALDADQLRGFLTTYEKHLKVMAAPLHPSQADEVTPQSITHILSLLRSMFRYVVIDGPAQFTDPLLNALDQTDIVVVVAMMDVPSIKNLRLSSQTLAELGIPRDRMRLVLNRADSKVGLTVKEIESSLGTQIDAQVPSSREVPYAVNQGQPIVTERPKSAVSAAIRNLLEQVRPAPMRRVANGDDTDRESKRFRIFR